MSPEEKTLRAPHPCAGYLAIAPFPRPDKQSGPDTPVTFAAVQRMMMGGTTSSDVISGVLLEIGPLIVEDDAAAEKLAPFEVGATIFYYEGIAIELGGFHYLPIQKYVAWDEAPE